MSVASASMALTSARKLDCSRARRALAWAVRAARSAVIARAWAAASLVRATRAWLASSTRSRAWAPWLAGAWMKRRSSSPKSRAWAKLIPSAPAGRPSTTSPMAAWA
jgi:hypothetical protein